MWTGFAAWKTASKHGNGITHQTFDEEEITLCYLLLQE